MEISFDALLENRATVFLAKIEAGKATICRFSALTRAPREWSLTRNHLANSF